MLKVCFGTTTEFNYDGISFHMHAPDFDVLHNHDFYEFTVVTDGSYENIVNGKKEILVKNTAILLGLNDSHRLKSAETPSLHLNILISKEKFEAVCNAIAPTILERFESMFPMKIQMENETLFKILSYLETLKISDDSNIRVYSSLIVHSIIESFFQKSVSNTLVPYPIALKNILVKCNDPENLSWKSADVCAYSNYSQTHINRLFKKYLNTSVTEYLTNIKMNAAKNMLTTTNYSISEISASLGYSSVSYFNKIFSKTFDSTPYKYKLKYFKKKEN